MFCIQNEKYQVNASGVEYLDGLYSYALVLSRNQADAENLVQETYVRAVQAMRRLRRESNTKSWFFTILRNLWVSQLSKRRSSPQMPMHDSYAAVGPSNCSSGLHVTTEREQVRAAIQELPIDFREVIVLRECEQLSYQEIASILGCPAETVQLRWERAHSKLRGVLADKFKMRLSPYA